MRKEPVRPSDGLRGLEVCEARHDDVDFALGAFDRDGDELAEVSAEEDELVPEPHAGVGGDLVVSGSAGVELTGDGADELAEPALVGGVDVLVAGDDDEGVGGPFLRDLPEALDERIALVVGDDARLGECLGVALAASDVLLRHPAVEGEGLVELLHERVDVLGEPPAPQLLLLARRSLGFRGHRHDGGPLRCPDGGAASHGAGSGDAVGRGGREDDGRGGNSHGHRYVRFVKTRASEGKPVASLCQSRALSAVWRLDSSNRGRLFRL